MRFGLGEECFADLLVWHECADIVRASLGGSEFERIGSSPLMTWSAHAGFRVIIDSVPHAELGQDSL